MEFRISSLAAAAGFVFAAGNFLMPPPLLAAPPPGYYLVWDSEFTGSSLDTTKWGYRLPGVFRDGYNTPNAVSFNGSNLVITTYTANGTNYTCMLYAENKFESKYGYWESSVQWSDSNGEWSAFWMLAPNYSLSTAQAEACPDINDPPTWGQEIDICEHRFVNGPSDTYDNISPYIQVNLHWNVDTNGEEDNVDDPGSPLVPSSGGLQNGFHTYGFLWTSTTYSFLIDGSQVYSNITTTPVMHCVEYPLLSSAVDDTSTTWAGYIPTGGYGSQATSATKLSVAYVRYYAPTNDFFWTGANSAYWDNSANWVSNLPPASNSDLTFSYLSTANGSMAMGQNYSLDGLIFLRSGEAFSLSDANTLTLGAGGIDMVSADYSVALNLPINLSANQTWAIGPNDPNGGLTLTVNGNISGPGTLTKASYGNLILNGTNTFSGAFNVDSGDSNANDGLVIISNAAGLSNVAAVSIRDTGNCVSGLQLSNGGTIPGMFNLAGRNTNNLPFESVAGTTELAGGLTLTAGGSNYLLQADSGSTVSIHGTVSSGDDATVTPTLTFQGSGAFSISGSIQNGTASALGLDKINVGSLTLYGTNNYTGLTTSSRTTLFVFGSLAGPVNIQAGGLSGTGSVAGVTTIVSGADLLPGTATANTIGTLSFGSNLTLSPGSKTVMNINAATQTNCQLNVAGALSCDGTLTVDNLGGTLAAGQSFKLFNCGSWVGGFSSVVLPGLNAGLAWNTNNLTNGVISVIGVSPAETLGISNGNGQVLLSWPYGTLQTATNVSGPYSGTTNVSPLSVPATNPEQYFRVREN